ncbi:MAG: alanine racemase [Candidatus Doudnabacteria bacterium]|nr:alanine racemase [Candidatus Doudnabacteria bacterium]
MEISKSALIHNAKQFRKVLGTASLMAVVKSNAYGHDSLLVSRLIEPYVDWFGTANLTEALELRANKIKKPILVLNYYKLGEADLAIKNNIRLVVYETGQARAISSAASKLKKKAIVHIKAGTGLSRLGVAAREVAGLVRQIQKFPNIKIEGLFSHFASSEDDPGFTMVQLGHFNKIIDDLNKANIQVPIKHIACTASALSFPESHFNLARIGIGIYGHQSYKSIHSLVKKRNPDFSLKPVMAWKAKILAVKDLPGGAYVGYGRTYKTARKTKLAILPVGYFEGYDRRLSNLAEVLVGGKRCKIRGRVYMNLVSADVTDVPNVKSGDEAVLIGKQGRQEILPDELGLIAGTINYEIMTRINPLLPRILGK